MSPKSAKPPNLKKRWEKKSLFWSLESVPKFFFGAPFFQTTWKKKILLKKKWESKKWEKLQTIKKALKERRRLGLGFFLFYKKDTQD